jgi:hypothetical protein
MLCLPVLLRESFPCTKDMGNKKMVGERRREVVFGFVIEMGSVLMKKTGSLKEIEPAAADR